MEGNEGTRPSDPRRISNEDAPPADPNRRRGGPPWGRIIAALIGLLLLALLIPLACQALRGGDPGGAGSTEGEQQGAQEPTNEQAQGGGETSSGETMSEAAPAGGDTAASGGGTTGGEVAERPSAGGAAAGAATGAALETGGEQSGDGTSVTVPQAQISGVDGWVAIHADDGGQPGEVIGHAPLSEGENADVAVPIDTPAPSGRLYAMVHADDPDDDRYTFPDGDPPVEMDGRPVVEPIQYTVAGEEAGGDLPASGGPPLMAALLTGCVALIAAGAVLLGRYLDGRKA